MIYDIFQRASTLGLMPGDIVAGWNSTTQTYDQSYVVGVSPPFRDFSIEPSTGYWIMATKAESLPLYGVIPTTLQSRTITVPGSGWAIIGFNSLRTDMYASDVVAMYSGGDVTQVVAYSPVGGYRAFNPLLPFTDFPLVPGQACWIFVTASGTLTYPLSESNIPPAAIFSSTTSHVTRTAQVDASASHDDDGYIASYQWDWGDGSPYAYGVTASHQYASGGGWWVTLTVTDDDGDMGYANDFAWFGPPTEPDLYVYGFTYAGDGSILTGCNVTVRNLMSGEVITTFSHGDLGFFQVMLGFGTIRVQIGDVVEVTATKGDLYGTNSAVVEWVGMAFIVIDVYLAPVV